MLHLRSLVLLELQQVLVSRHDNICAGFYGTFQAVKRSDRRQDMGRIRPLRASGFDPPTRFAGRQEGIEEPLSGLMGEQALAKIVQQGEVEARVMQVKAEGLLPIHAAPDRIGRLAVGEPFHILHHDDQGQAPGGHFHRTALGGIEIGKELIRIERAKLGPQVDVEIAFREGGAYCSRGHVWNGGEGFGA